MGQTVTAAAGGRGGGRGMGETADDRKRERAESRVSGAGSQMSENY